MKFRLTIYTAFEAESPKVADDISRTIQSTLENHGVIVDETVLEEDVRISLEESINNIKHEA
jgi:hypothetical protein